jgi:hypothetical protein
MPMAKMNKLFLKDYERMRHAAFIKEKVEDSPRAIERRKALREYVTEIEKKNFVS